MKSNDILKADVLDIIFENKNKDYGAYDLRKTYNKRIKVAIASMIGICLLASVATVMANNNDGKKVEFEHIIEVDLANAEPKAPPIVPPPPPPPPPPIELPRIREIQSTTIVLANDVDVPPPTQEDQDNAIIGKRNIDGVDDLGIIAPPVETGIGKVEVPKVVEIFEKEFTTVQIEAKFPGGLAAWKKYLERNLKSQTPTENGAPEGVYAVVVSFVVNKDGEVSEVRALNDPGFGTASEAVRAIQQGQVKWIPAVQNGRNVIYRQKQQITFQVQSEQ